MLVAVLLLLVQDLPPEYDSWANCKVGSTVRFKIERDDKGRKMEAELTVKLLELTAEKAVLDSRPKMKVGGKTVDAPPEKTTIKAKEVAAGKIEKESEEELDLAGKKVKCRVIEAVAEIGDGKVRKKLWLSPEIPGGIVKSEIKGDGDKITSRTIVLSWEKK
jgi:hypothetical protein